ncbi:MAG: carbohydrate-binding family 9-like protein [Bacteroidota bacterium]
MKNSSGWHRHFRSENREMEQWLPSVAGLLFMGFLLAAMMPSRLVAQELKSPDGDPSAPVWMVRHVDDFEVTGDGSNPAWSQTEWVSLTRRSNPTRVPDYRTRAKLLYSDNGLYLLFDNVDEVVTATMQEHFQRLWQEDVIELFLWTDPTRRTYFEYELSPLNRELPIIVDNVDGELTHWLPFFHSYDEDHPRKTVHKVSFRGLESTDDPAEVADSALTGASISGWSAEVYIPFDLLRPLENERPTSGTTWRANLYRIDYDEGSVHWSWQPFRNNFHDIDRFGTLLFD